MSLVGVVAASLGSAAFFSLATALKHKSAGSTPHLEHFRPRDLLRLTAATLRHPMWLGGILADVGGLALQVLALHIGALTVVQPLLVTAVLFSLVVGHRLAGTRVSRRELALGAVLVVTVAGFLAVSGAATAQAAGTDRLPAVVASVSAVVVIGGCIVAARRRTRVKPRSRRAAALMGVAVGIVYACTAVLIKVSTTILERGPVALLTSWQPYALVAAGGVGLLLAQVAFQAGPLASSLPATATTDPLVSVVLGVVVFDEQLRSSLLPVVASLACLTLMSVAVVLLSRIRAEVDEIVLGHAPAEAVGPVPPDGVSR